MQENKADKTNHQETDAKETGGDNDPVELLAEVRHGEELGRISHALDAAGLVAYHWDLSDDTLSWYGAVDAILPGCAPMRMRTGKGYASLRDTTEKEGRYDTVMAGGTDEGNGVFFQTEYTLCPNGRHMEERYRIEDSGRWYGDKAGNPAQVIGIVRRIDERHAAVQQLQFRSDRDPLTGLTNRTKLSEYLSQAMDGAASESRTCAFFIAAIGNLSVVNESYGYDAADDVIIAVAERLQEVMRGCDLIGRYAGSKFGLVLNDCNESELSIAAERFSAAVRDTVIETERGPVWATLSIGGLVLPKHADSAEKAMSYAEEALIEAKRQTGHTFVHFQPSHDRESVRSLNSRCASEIVAGLKEERFVLAYQPVIDINTNEIAMYEAFLRMLVPPDETIEASHLVPLAEKLGLIRLVDERVAGLIIEAAKQNPDLQLSLNISRVTVSDQRWCRIIQQLIRDNKEVAPRLMVEISESVALQDMQQCIHLISDLHELGCKVAIDDFGSGYASFRNLQLLNADVVKIQGSFCENLALNADNQFFVRSLLDLAQKFDMKTVAKWVEREVDADLLKTWGVDYIQGNLPGVEVFDLKTGSTAVPSLPLVNRETSEQRTPQRAQQTSLASGDPSEHGIADIKGLDALVQSVVAPETQAAAPALDQEGPDLSLLRSAIGTLDQN